MSVITGAMALLRADNRIVGKVNNVNVRPRLQTDVSEEIGKYHINEVIYTSVDAVEVDFDIEREAQKGLVRQGLWPDTSNDFNIMNFQGLTLEVQDKSTGAILHKITGWKPTSKDITFTKGQKVMYRVSGLGIKEEEKDN